MRRKCRQATRNKKSRFKKGPNTELTANTFGARGVKKETIPHLPPTKEEGQLRGVEVIPDKTREAVKKGLAITNINFERR